MSKSAITKGDDLKSGGAARQSLTS